MKTKKLLLATIFAAFLTSAIPSGSHSLEIGYEAPLITLSPSASTSLFTDHQTTVVQFWSAADPASRISNRELSRKAESLFNSNTRYISICIDEDDALASEILKTDGISSKVITLGRADISADVLRDFQTDTGCRTFTIDPFGILRSISI